MARPSLQASQLGIQSARLALTKQGMIQKDLVEQLGYSRHPISKFFTGKPVEQDIFISICKQLKLDWLDVAEISSIQSLEATETPQQSKNVDEIDLLVENVRSKIKDNIQERCGTMRVLDMSQPVGLSDIYTKVNILEKITGRRWKELGELLRSLDLENLEKFSFDRIQSERVSGLDAVQRYQKLIVLGKPGAGKTTFLKYVAIECNQGKFLSHLVPIFVTLKDFLETPDEPSLLEYIGLKFSESGVTSTEIQEILSNNAALLLIDGLDEVKQEDCRRLLREIRNLHEKFSENHIIITCRIAAFEYTFEKFTEVEIADFDQEQITIFAENWFKNKLVKAKDFLQQLSNNYRIQQLAVNPLLLTLLCLAFEESGHFPANRSELYKEGLDIFLKNWDAKRGIERDQVYKQISLQRKKDLLSHIAFSTFESGHYLFSQSSAESYIDLYLRQLPKNATESEYLQVDSETILHSIEAQHGLLVERAKGIYSFSHLTFHEYFTAREIVWRSPELEEGLQRLVQHIYEKRWREVFLITTEMLQPDASKLLQAMKQKVDDLLMGNKKLQDFLQYVAEISSSRELPIKQVALRAFYFDIDFEIDAERSLCLLLDRSANILVCASFFSRVFQNTDFDSAVDLVLSHDRRTTDPAQKIINADDANETMYLAVKLALESKQIEPNLKNKLERIYQEDIGEAELAALDKEQVKLLADSARNIAKSHYHLSRKDWLFTHDEKKLLKQYYYANKLLVECLNSDCRANTQVCLDILNSLLLPSQQS